MRHDILFHLTTSENFKSSQTHTNYEPESLSTGEFIPCVGGEHVEEVANSLFPDEETILILVIDVSTLQSEVKYEKKKSGNHSPRIVGPLNKDAIIDKIEIKSEDNGEFNISFKSYS